MILLKNNFSKPLARSNVQIKNSCALNTIFHGELHSDFPKRVTVRAVKILLKANTGRLLIEHWDIDVCYNLIFIKSLTLSLIIILFINVDFIKQ